MAIKIVSFPIGNPGVMLVHQRVPSFLPSGHETWEPTIALKPGIRSFPDWIQGKSNPIWGRINMD